MRKIILTILASSLMAASTVQIATAAERHAHQTHRDNFRGAYNQLSTSSHVTSATGYGWDTGNSWRDDAKFEPAGN
jgi:Ni/Co efflux regulator RcnB